MKLATQSVWPSTCTACENFLYGCLLMVVNNAFRGTTIIPQCAGDLAGSRGPGWPR